MSESIETKQTVAMKQDSDSIELKPVEQSSMPLACLKPQTTLPVQSLKSSHGKSRGMFRHKFVLAGTFLIAVATLGLTGFDLAFLIGQEGTIDRKFDFTRVKEDPDLPGLMTYNAPDETRGLKLRPFYDGDVTGGRNGFVDDTGRVVVAPRYYAVKTFSEGLAAVKLREDGNWGYINTAGKLDIPAVYSKANYFHHGYARVAKGTNEDEESLLIDAKGHAVELHGAVPVKDVGAYFVIRNADNLYGLVKNGKVIIPCKYDEISKTAQVGGFDAFSTDMGGPTDGDAPQSSLKPYFKLLNADNPSYGLADSNGKVLLKGGYDDIQNVHNGHLIFTKDALNGICDVKGKLLVAAKYDQLTRFDDLIAARIGSKISLLNSMGKPVEGPQIDNIKIDSQSLQWLHDGRGVFRRKNLYGYLDAQGREVIPAKYEDAQAFDGGVARVKNGMRTMYIDKQGNRVDKTGYAEAAPFHDGKAKVTLPGPLFDAIVSYPQLYVPTNGFRWGHNGVLSRAIAVEKDYTNQSPTEFEFDDSETE